MRACLYVHDYRRRDDCSISNQYRRQCIPAKRYDAVIVDESQEFRPVWCIPVETLLSDKRDGVLYVFYDPNQERYGGGPADDLGLKATSLKYNCRNTNNIAEYSCKLVGLEPYLKPGAPVGETVIVPSSCKDSKDMVDAVRKFVHKLVNENNISTTPIAILTTGSVKFSPVHRVGKLGNVTLVSLEHEPGPNEIRFESLHRFIRPGRGSVWRRRDALSANLGALH